MIIISYLLVSTLLIKIINTACGNIRYKYYKENGTQYYQLIIFSKFINENASGLNCISLINYGCKLTFSKTSFIL